MWNVCADNVIEYYWTTYIDILAPSLQWRHNERDGVSNHRHLYHSLSRLFRRRSRKISKLCVTGLCEGNSLVAGEVHAQRASDMEKTFPFNRFGRKLRYKYSVAVSTDHKCVIIFMELKYTTELCTSLGLNLSFQYCQVQRGFHNNTCRRLNISIIWYIITVGMAGLNIPKARQCDHHFADDIFKFIFRLIIVTSLFKFHWNLFTGQLTMCHHRVR